MNKISLLTVTVMLIAGLSLSSCGKKGNLERPPAKKDKQEMSIAPDRSDLRLA